MLRQDGLVLESNSIPLSVSYLGEDTAVIEILISIPMSESAGELHEIEVEVTPDGIDIDASDNVITHMMMTGSVPTCVILNSWSDFAFIQVDDCPG